jgi:flagellin
MASILTNNNAMAALQTLRGISSNMETTQNRISSGLRVGTASDNAAYWSIATTMRSDNAALSSVQDAMGLGAAKIDTAYAGMEAAIDVVTEIKNKLVTAAEGSADKAKIQEEITQLQGQLKSIAESASFSGENWLQTEVKVDADGLVENTTKQVVGSFTRDSSGNVSVKTINVELNDTNVLFDLSGGNKGLLDAEALAKGQVAVEGVTVEDGTTTTTTNYYATSISDADIADLIAANADDNTNAEIYDDGTNTYFQVSKDNWVKVTDTDPAGTNTTSDVFSDGTTSWYLDTSAASTTATLVDGLSVYELDITDLATLDIGDAEATDEEKLAFMTQFVDTQLEAMTSAAAELGAVSGRISMQEEFVSKLQDSLDRGIGRLVDADMNEESTRLQALQTQQQLAIQALSIANSSSENILSLFR